MKKKIKKTFELLTNNYIFAPALRKCKIHNGEIAQSVRAQDS
jgi:hypothetical protein